MEKFKINGTVGAFLNDLKIVTDRHSADVIMEELSRTNPCAFAAIMSVRTHIEDTLRFWEGIIKDGE